MIKRIELILNDKYKPIILLTIISLAFRLIVYDFELRKSLVQVLTIFIFATFISFMITTFKKLYNKNDSFFNWWWKIYGIMIFGGIMSWMAFGEL